jgi:hypothetical protein
LVWLFEKSASAVIFLFVMYFLSAFIPGEAGRQFRGLLTRLCTETFRFAFMILQRVFEAIFRTLGAGTRRR